MVNTVEGFACKSQFPAVKVSNYECEAECSLKKKKKKDMLNTELQGGELMTHF